MSPHRLAGDWIKADRRFVHEQHGRMMKHALGDLEPANHAARVALHQVVGGVAEPHGRESLFDTQLLLGMRNAVEPGRQQKIFAPGE